MYYVQKVNLSADAAKHTLKGLTILYKRAIIYTQIATLLSQSDAPTSVWQRGVLERQFQCSLRSVYFFY